MKFKSTIDRQPMPRASLGPRCDMHARNVSVGYALTRVQVCAERVTQKQPAQEAHEKTRVLNGSF